MAERSASKPNTSRRSTNTASVSVSRRCCIPTVWLLALIMFCCQTGSYGLTFWVPTIVKGLSGYTELEVGCSLGHCRTSRPRSAWCWSAAAPIAAASASCTSRSPRRSARCGFIATGLMHSPIPAMIALAVAAVGDYGTRGPFWALPGKFLAGSAAAGAIALINAMGAVGGAIGPPAVGLSQGHHRDRSSGRCACWRASCWSARC